MTDKHWLGVDGVGARDVPTPTLRLLLRVGPRVVRQRSILVAIGAPGTGKSFAVRTLCEQVPGHAYVPVDANMTPHVFLRRLHRSLTGREADRELRGHLLEADVIEALQMRRPVLVIDDANFLGRALIAQFIFLQASADFALVLVGHRLDAILRKSPELETRIARSVAFRCLTGERLIEALRAYHDIFHRTDRLVLDTIDRHWARGNFRRWASILEVAATEYAAAAHTGLTPDLGRRVVGAITGGAYGIPLQEPAA